MNNRRALHSSCALGGRIYVIGGRDDNDGSIESLDARNGKTWYVIVT